MLTVNDRFPDFHAKACDGIGKDDITDVTLAGLGDRWKLFLFYPKDFSFVCPTELVEFARRHGDFAERDCTIVAGSTDNEYAHLAWRRSHDDLRELPYPILAANSLAAELGILEPAERVCMRATFIVDPHNVIQYASVHNLSVGRSVEEVLRTLDAIQSDELCPCNWTKGERTLTPA